MVDGNGLENRRARKGTEGSNPSLSAKLKSRLLSRLFSLMSSEVLEPVLFALAKKGSLNSLITRWADRLFRYSHPSL